MRNMLALLALIAAPAPAATSEQTRAGQSLDNLLADWHPQFTFGDSAYGPVRFATKDCRSTLTNAHGNWSIDWSRVTYNSAMAEGNEAIDLEAGGKSAGSIDFDAAETAVVFPNVMQHFDEIIAACHKS